ncbi:hypothetical protein ACEPPN_019230 [Leptodophora sp. 'Broadleaf-Isolate-01']
MAIPFDNPAIPSGSTVLVTGVNGFLASHIADQFLRLGYSVIGTVRDAAKNAWLTRLFDRKYGEGRFELVTVEDIAVDGAYDLAVKGVSSIIHTASIVSFDLDPNRVVPAAIAFALNALKAAYKQPSVKRFVMLSSSTAAFVPIADTRGAVVTKDTWNETSVKAAWVDPPYTRDRSWIVYAASKTQSEQELWKFHKDNREKRPDLVLNTVLPTIVFGAALDPMNQGYTSTSRLIFNLWNGTVTEEMAEFFVDAQDMALLHVAAAIHPDVQEERLFGFSQPFNWNIILNILRKQNPQRTFPEDFQAGQDLSEIQPRVRAEQLLRDMGKSGWTSLEESIRMNTKELCEGILEDAKI